MGNDHMWSRGGGSTPKKLDLVRVMIATKALGSDPNTIMSVLNKNKPLANALKSTVLKPEHGKFAFQVLVKNPDGSTSVRTVMAKDKTSIQKALKEDGVKVTDIYTEQSFKNLMRYGSGKRTEQAVARSVDDYVIAARLKRAGKARAAYERRKAKRAEAGGK